jgi:hypothetical protein
LTGRNHEKTPVRIEGERALKRKNLMGRLKWCLPCLGPVAITTEHGPTLFGLERHRRRLAAIGADRLVKLPFGAGAVEVAVATAATTTAMPTTATAMSATTTAAAALRLVGLALLAAVAATLRRMLETALGVSLLILGRVDELRTTVRTFDHHVIIHLPSTSRYKKGAGRRTSMRVPAL